MIAALGRAWRWARRETYGTWAPWLAFIGGTGFGGFGETHSRWHDGTWPAYGVAVVSVAVSYSQIRRAKCRHGLRGR